MTIPPYHIAMPFHGNMGNPIPGPIPGQVPGTIQAAHPGHIPVTLQPPIMSGPMVNGNNSTLHNVSPPVQALRLPMVPVGGGCYNDGMEVVWHGEFSRLFSSFYPPHVWYLSITNSAPEEKWKFCRDSAKVRFCCQDCGNGWTSMKGRVTFWFHLNVGTGEGFVQFKLYGQVCKKCNSGKFEYVMWYPEEVSKVMCNLYNKVGQTFYGFMQPPIRIDRRPGRPRNQHNADLCQACRDGECDQGRPVKAMYNYLPPNVPRANQQNLPPRSQVPPSTMSQVSPTMPVVIRQPPMPSSGQIVLQPPMNPPPPGSHSAPSLITAPVTLTAGVQPILTYSIVTDAPKDSPVATPVPDAVLPPTTSFSQLSITGDPPVQSKAQNALCVGVSAAPTFVTGNNTTAHIKQQIADGAAKSNSVIMKAGNATQEHIIPQISTDKPVVNGTESTAKFQIGANVTSMKHDRQKHGTPLVNGHACDMNGTMDAK